MAPSIDDYRFQNVNRIGNVGDMRQAQDQRRIDAERERYEYNENAEGNWLDQYLGRVYASPAAGWTTTNQTNTTTGGSKLGAALGGALALGQAFTPGGAFAGLGSMAARGFGFGGGTMSMPVTSAFMPIGFGR
jgi:hypothetical protein